MVSFSLRLPLLPLPSRPQIGPRRAAVIMASANTFGASNTGFQVGISHGAISAQFYLPPEHPETPPEPLSTVPFSRDPDFVDRGALLDRINEKCSTRGSKLGLVGLGGVGKSQLAIEYSYRVRERSAQIWVFWIYASNAARFEQSYQEIADRARIPGRHDPKANIMKLVFSWLQDERRDWVIILDNVDDDQFLREPPEAKPGQAGTSVPLAAYLPRNNKGSIIMTTRSKSVASRFVSDRDIIEIQPMVDIHAVALIGKKIGDHAAHESKEDISRLAEVLEYMPLAIVQAGAYIKRRAPRYSVREYLEDFQKSDRKKLELLTDHEGGHIHRDYEAKNSIMATWQLSFDRIRETKPAAAELLSLMSFFDRQGIAENLLRCIPYGGADDINKAFGDTGDGSSGSERNPYRATMRNDPRTHVDLSDEDEDSTTDSECDEFEENIMLLRDYSFVSLGRDRGTFEMHRLVQLATQRWLDTHRDSERWRWRFVKFMATEFPNGDFETWEKCQLLYPHAKMATAQRPTSERAQLDWARLLYKMATYACKKGHLADAKTMARKSAKTYERILGPEDEDTLNSTTVLAITYEEDKQLDEAEALRTRLFHTHKKLFGLDDPNTLTEMEGLAAIHSRKGRLKEAEALELEVLEARRRVLGPENIATLNIMRNLAATYCYQDRLQEAEDLCAQVLEINERVLSPEHPDRSGSMCDLAHVYLIQNRWKEGETLLIKALKQLRKVVDLEHPFSMGGLGNLVYLYRLQERWQEAEPLNLQLFEAHRRLYGPKHLKTLDSMKKLARVYRKQEKWETAKVTYTQLLEKQQEVLGPDDLETLECMRDLASVYYLQGNYEEAAVLDHTVLEAFEKVFGLEHHRTLNSMLDLAAVYESQTQLEKAAVMLDRAFRIQKRVLGDKHLDTLHSMRCLALLYGRLGRREEAKALRSAAALL
ncbi:uncharacterized protein N7482_005663 [Penicillium canariense]|uniref:NB-ARC domain-containing protein n=1 Tax=Penicillium canariense TaxID=189055 RepID=A0A9W9I6Z9_9EURO|nr:uncharacterized protein N7482_005663 [Penicillium canariense]KAJ5166882.1 hypothetical protein N7482_005663 [Penicillium canariense]